MSRRGPKPRKLLIQTMGPRPHFGGRGSSAGPLPENRCPQSGKRKFVDESSAIRQAAEWAHQNASQYGSAYLCPHCGSWHLRKKGKIA